MAVVQDGDRGLVFGMVQGAFGLVLLHHGLGLGPECCAQPVQLAHQMRHVTAGVLEDDGLQVLGPGDAVLDAEPAAPGLAEQMHLAEPQGLADRIELPGVALDRPERGVVRAVGGAAAELVVGDDAIAVVGEAGMRLAQVVAGQPRPAIDAEHRLGAAAEAVGDDPVAVDRHLDDLIGAAFLRHRVLALCCSLPVSARHHFAPRPMVAAIQLIVRAEARLKSARRRTRAGISPGGY